jgi:hypothetical protein
VNEEDRNHFLDEEIVLVRNSGEIPEIALHGAIYFLEEEREGPHLSLRAEELERLYDAAQKRYLEIVLRDLDPDNRDLRIYRGIARSMVNWQRMRNFCTRVGRDCSGFRKSVNDALAAFLVREYNDVSSGRRRSSVNCCLNDLIFFFDQLLFDLALLPKGWEIICQG